MTKKEKQKIIDEVNQLTNEQLEQEYYDSVLDCLGSETERMYELGYDIADIVAQDKYEKYLCQRADVLEKCCVERGINLWGRKDESTKET